MLRDNEGIWEWSSRRTGQFKAVNAGGRRRASALTVFSAQSSLITTQAGAPEDLATADAPLNRPVLVIGVRNDPVDQTGKKGKGIKHDTLARTCSLISPCDDCFIQSASDR